MRRIVDHAQHRVADARGEARGVGDRHARIRRTCRSSELSRGGRCGPRGYTRVAVTRGERCTRARAGGDRRGIAGRGARGSPCVIRTCCLMLSAYPRMSSCDTRRRISRRINQPAKRRGARGGWTTAPHLHRDLAQLRTPRPAHICARRDLPASAAGWRTRENASSSARVTCWVVCCPRLEKRCT